MGIGSLACLEIFCGVHVRALDSEWIMVCWGCSSVAFMPLMDRWLAATITAASPSEFWGVDPRGDIGSTFLSCDAIVTCFCLFLPIRVWTMWPLVVSSVLGFALFYGLGGSPFPELLFRDLSTLAMLGIFALIGSFQHERHVREGWRSQREVVKQQDVLDGQHVGLSRLLTRFCDSLVVIGPTFEILELCPAFAAMLLISKEQTMQGKDFCAYLAEEQDRANFKVTIARTDPNVDCTDTVPLHMKDSLGREILVHAHTALFLNRKSELRYLIGIVENEEHKRNTFQIREGTLEIDGIAPLKLGNSASCGSSSSSSDVDWIQQMEKIAVVGRSPKSKISSECKERPSPR